ncbi:hypothetical protein K474DRAFT_1772959 [Panus rudis PR-1116 ss-1]|nr:hypothetical protein K474DRAFT_1772959 [Panus rudis PR-1116 ss-1]
MEVNGNLNIRDVYRPLSFVEILFRGTVQIFHPGHDRLFLSLPAYDSLQHQGGVNYRLVSEACYILANNRDGFFTTDRAGSQRVPDDHPLLIIGKYYYWCDLGDPLYPVVVDFAAWTFSHELPASWSRHRTDQECAERDLYSYSRSDMSDGVKLTDKACIATRYETPYGCQNAHLVPRDQEDWFNANGMDQYSVNMSAGIQDVANGVTLRSDVHAFFEGNGFVFYPPTSDGSEFVPYVCMRVPVYAELLHRRSVVMHTRVAEQFLYARFAYTMISRVPSSWTTLNTVVPIPQAIFTIRQAKQKYKEKAPTSPHHSHHHGDMAEAIAHHIGASSLKQTVSEEEDFAAYEKGWKETFAQRFPWIQQLPEVEDPPNILVTGAHIDGPRMLRLRREYMERNPQVQQVVGPTASELDLMHEPEDDGVDDVPTAPAYCKLQKAWSFAHGIHFLRFVLMASTNMKCQPFESEPTAHSIPGPASMVSPLHSAFPHKDNPAPVVLPSSV